MPDASRLSRGDRNRRLERIRSLVPTTNAVLGIDLADRKQAAVLTDHDSRTLARVHGHEKVAGVGQVEVPAGGQVRSSLVAM